MSVAIFATSRIILSSAFSNRMIGGAGLVHKVDLTVDEAKEMIALAESSSKIAFENAINPRHESTAALAQGLTKSECMGGFVSLNDFDVVVVMQPSASSRNDTEFNLEHFNECKFELLQRLPVSMIGR
jgi:hypothetical protein